MFRITALLPLFSLLLFAQKTVPLWPEGAPGAVGSEDRDQPSITIYLAPEDKATGAAVVVCPGGGYHALAMDHEGKQIAGWLNDKGVAAFVVKYRLGPRYHHPAPLEDAQRAIRFVRYNAKEYGVDGSRIGIWGFSAGGHLVSTAATHFDAGDPGAKSPVDRVSCRPDLLILCYPVISMKDPVTHTGSRQNLLGDAPAPALVESLSNDTQVTAQTPPTFLFHTTDDQAVPVENSIRFYNALHKAGVPAEMHIYEHGPHGVGLAQRDPALSTWPGLLSNWLNARGFLTRKGR